MRILRTPDDAADGLADYPIERRYISIPSGNGQELRVHLVAVAPDGWKPITARIPGAANQPHTILQGGGHFVQEDLPDLYTQALLTWMGALA